MKRFRRFRFPILFALAVSLAGYVVWPREPVYEGRDLSAWTGELVELERRAPLVEANEQTKPARDARHEKAVAAVRGIGVKALPHLLRWLRSSPVLTPLRDKLQDLLDEHTSWNLKLPERPDHRYQAVVGFRALGSTAEPALLELRRLLRKPATCEGAVFALGAIGPAAVPILAPELNNSNFPAQPYVVTALMKLAPSAGRSIAPVLADGVTNRGCLVHAECLAGLGDLGPLAREFAPWLGTLAQEPGNPLAGPAMWVVAGVSDSPQQYLPLFSDRLNDTNWARHAAFALARMGPDGVPTLLRALTNQEPVIKGAALAALNPTFRYRQPSSGATSLTRRFSRLRDSFDLLASSWVKNPRATPSKLYLENLRIPFGLQAQMDHPDAGVRLQVAQLLARYGRDSAIGLSRASADTDERVRAEARAALADLRIDVRDGGITRGTTDQRRIALIFAGHEYAEGGETILNELATHKAQASFFLTGNFLSDFGSLARRLYREGHYLGPRSYKRLLYCSVAEPKRTLVTHEEFDDDFRGSLDRVQRIGNCGPFPCYFLPPEESYNLDIAEWAGNYFFATIRNTPGTHSTEDCTTEAEPDFVSSKAIFDSIVAKEQQDPHGLNGFLLLLHVGSGPNRTDKFHARFGELLDYLSRKGYQFVSVNELFDPQASAERRRRIAGTVEDPTPGSDAAVREAFRKRYGLDR